MREISIHSFSCVMAERNGIVDKVSINSAQIMKVEYLIEKRPFWVIAEAGNCTFCFIAEGML